MKDREFLIWLHERLEHVNGESPAVDYMHKLRAIIRDTPEEGGFDPKTDEAMKAALIDADHLAECAERLLRALNRKAGALERIEVADMGDTGAPQRAAIELEQAEEEVSEFWRAVRSATYEYRKRAERARQAMVSNAGVQAPCADYCARSPGAKC